jgi:hypothetical protein
MPHFPQSNLHQNIISQFGLETLGLFCFLERKTHQQVKWASHLHFNMHCRHHHITTCSIHIQSNIKGAKAESILQKAERALLVERIHQCVIKNNETSHIVKKAKCQMQAATNDATSWAIQGCMQRTYQTIFNTAQNQQQNKFHNLQQQQQQHQEQNRPNRASIATPTLCADISQEEIATFKKNWIFNLTEVPLSNDAKNALTKGLTFTPTPRNLPATDLIVASEEAATLLGGDTEAATHITSHTINAIRKFQAPQSNITRGEQESIKELKEDRNITILPADKGCARVLILTTQYKN